MIIQTTSRLEAMPTLKIDFREGFDGESIEVAVGGRVLATKHDLRTRMQIGFAGDLVLDLPVGQQVIDVRVPESGASLRVELDPAVKSYLAVNLVGHRPVQDDDPPRYA